MGARLGIAAAAAALGLGFVGPVAAQAPQAAPSPQSPQSPADALPDGPGKDVTLRVCTQCHDASQFAYARMSPAEWDTEISKMQSAGALMSADEQLAISAYLGKYLSKAPPSAAPSTPETKAPPQP